MKPVGFKRLGESGYCLLCLNQECYDVLDMEFGTLWKQFSHKITLCYESNCITNTKIL